MIKLIFVGYGHDHNDFVILIIHLANMFWLLGLPYKPWLFME